jgi:ABC-type bacteriocin/lantibiotic exporter with double-glycine peptidase domain
MIYEQKKDGWCGPASLSYALMKQGIDISQDEIAKKTETTVKDGVDPAPLIKFVNSLDLQTKVFNGDDADETLENMAHFLYFGYSCLVDYLAGNSIEDGHYVVVEEIEEDEIKIWNPSGGKHEELKKDYFVKHWRDKTENGKPLRHWAFCFKKV